MKENMASALVGSVDDRITTEMVDIGVGKIVEGCMVSSIADSTSSWVLVPALLPSGVALGLVMLPAEAIAASLDLLEQFSFGLKTEVIPLALAIREPGAGQGLTLQGERMVVITSLTLAILQLLLLELLCGGHLDTRVGFGGRVVGRVTLWYRVEIEVPLFLSQNWPDTFKIQL